jgi:glucokinase
MSRHVYVGLDVGGTNIRCALVRGHRIVKRASLASRADKGCDASLRQIQAAIDGFDTKIHGIGIGIAGIIDSKRGIVRYSPNMPGWNDVPLVKILEKKFSVPVRILNDVNAACLGEWRYGAAQGRNDVFMLTVGTGVGGAAVCNGELQFGAHGFAGEIGHVVIRDRGRKCACGNRGCLEQYVGARPISRLARKLMKNRKSSLSRSDTIDPRTIASAAHKGDRVARDVYAQVGYYLGVGITSVINLFDPEIVIIAGGIAQAGKILFDPIKETVNKRVMGRKFRNFSIMPPKLGDDAGILGAVYYAKSKGQLRG